MVTKVIVKKSNRPMKKWMAEFDNGRVVHFGATGYQDFTQHKDPERMRLYKIRHGGGRENHGKSGLFTAGFWSMWLLWNKPSLQASARDMERRFGLKISFSKGSGSKKTAKQRTSRKLRTRKMSGLLDNVKDPDVMSRILTFLPPADIREMASASTSDRAVAKYFLEKQPEGYFDMNRFRNMIQYRGLLDLTTIEIARRYFDLNDSTNSLRAEYIRMSPYVRLTSKDGRKLLPGGIKTVEFRNSNVRQSDLEDAKSQDWWDKYFTEDFNEPVKKGELPDGLVTILNLDRKLEMESIPSTVEEITYAEGYLFDYDMDLLPESLDKITVPFSGFEDNQDYFNLLPLPLKNKVFVVVNTGFRNPYDGEYEEDSEEFTISEAFDIIDRREQEMIDYMNNMNELYGYV